MVVSASSRFRCLWVLALTLGVSSASSALTVSVGNGGCQYIGLQFALDELESQPGPHVIKLKTQTIAIPNGLVLDVRSTNYRYSFIGGHASCNDAQPTPGQRTILDASGGSQGTAFVIDATSSSPNFSREVTLSAITVTGGDSETGPFANPEGGGLEIRGEVRVRLANSTSIELNASGRGGGVYLRGIGPTERATLELADASDVALNQATNEGGGVYCADHGWLEFSNGQVAFNNSGGNGGGIYLGANCGLYAQPELGGFTGLNGNTAGGAGGGLYQRGIGRIQVEGSSVAPFWVLANTAALQGGGLLLRNDSDTRSFASLSGTVVKDNRTPGTFGAALGVLGPIKVDFVPPPGSTTCAHPGVGLGACSAIVGNRHTNRTTNVGGVVHVARVSESLFPILVMERTLLSGNYGRSIITSTATSDITLSELVLTGNELNVRGETFGAPAAIVQFEGSTDAKLRRSTLVGNTADAPGGALLDYAAAFAMDISGSILHNPGLMARTSGSPAAVVTDNCVLTHQAGAFQPPVVVADPLLAADLTPSATSPALDQCRGVVATLSDFRGNARSIDQPGVPNGIGPVDLGAIERPADPPPDAPSLTISLDGVIVPDGSTTPFVPGLTDFGNVPVGVPLVRAFRVRNTVSATATLTFSAHNLSGACAGGFRLGALPTSLAPGTFQAMDIIFDPVVEGECIATYQMFSNDPDNSPYDFQVRGLGVGSTIFANGFE